MARIHEVNDLQPERQTIWLAAQIDELEASFIGRMDKLTLELAATRKILTGILISLLVGLIAIPIGVIWEHAVGK